MKSSTVWAYLCVGLTICLFACQKEPGSTTTTTTTTVTAPSTTEPTFSRDSAYAYVANQLDFGPRVPGSASHKACKDWMVQKLSEFGLEVQEQDFTATMPDGKTVAATNVIGRYRPDASQRLLLGAHWDSRYIADSPLNEGGTIEAPILGADDGGSGVAVLLEIARQLETTPANIGVDIVFFDAEDQGEPGGLKTETWCQGAQYFAQHLPAPAGSYRYGILLDMVGAKGARFTKEGTSMRYAPAVMNKVWELADQLGYSNAFVDEASGPVTDDHYFINTMAQVKMINIINRPRGSQTGFVPHWHTPGDDLSVIDSRMLRTVGKLVQQVIYREAAGTL